VRRAGAVAAALAALALLIGVAFAGSQSALAPGTEIAGVGVGGLTAREATRLLSERAESVERVPITFTAGADSFQLSASQLGVKANWRAAARAATAEGDGFGPVRGFRRLHTRFFGAEVAPSLSVYTSALDYKLDQIAAAVDRAAVAAKLRRTGLAVAIVPGQSGRRLDRDAAAATIVRALGSFERGAPVDLVVVSTPPRVREAELATAARLARTALSAPVYMTYEKTRWRLPPWRIAALLDLPSGGGTRVAVAGPGAEDYLERLSARIERRPQDARFTVTATGKIALVPSRPGLQLDMPATVKALAAAAFAPANRTGRLAVRVALPERTTEQAAAMGINGVVSSYTTTYGGTPGRLNNVQLVARLIDGTLIAPGRTFSFNQTTGERSAAKGFQEAPVIINGELQSGIGGGVCQVSTTVFNAAYEAGLGIEQRTNHALYISHYPLGRDATVNYPDLDLRFTNDTGKWLLLRTFAGSGSLTVNLYGTPVDRTVESETTPLTVTGAVPIKEIEDPALLKGRRVIEEIGAPPRQTSVHRSVAAADGKLLHDDVWRSFYVGEPTVVRVGTKEPPKPPEPLPGQSVSPGPGSLIPGLPVAPAPDATAAPDVATATSAPVAATVTTAPATQP